MTNVRPTRLVSGASLTTASRPLFERQALVPVQIDFEHVPFPDLAFERLGRIQHQQLAMIHDGHTPRHAVGFVHVVGGQDDRAVALPGPFADVLAHQHATLRIQTCFRFIQRQDVGIVDQVPG